MTIKLYRCFTHLLCLLELCLLQIFVAEAANTRPQTVGSCNGHAYSIRMQICCRGQIWEDPHGLYTCCGEIPCLTDVGVSVYQVFKGKYTDGLSGYMNGGGNARVAQSQIEPASSAPVFQDAPVQLPRGTAAISFSRSRMRGPHYMIYRSNGPERISESAYYLPPPKVKLSRHRIVPIAQTRQPQVAVPRPQNGGYAPASPVLAVRPAPQKPVVLPMPVVPANNSPPQITIRIEAESGDSDFTVLKTAPSGNEPQILTSEPAPVATQNLTVNQSEQPETGNNFNDFVQDTDSLLGAELLKLLRNVQPVPMLRADPWSAGQALFSYAAPYQPKGRWHYRKLQRTNNRRPRASLSTPLSNGNPVSKNAQPLVIENVVKESDPNFYDLEPLYYEATADERHSSPNVNIAASFNNNAWASRRQQQRPHGKSQHRRRRRRNLNRRH